MKMALHKDDVVLVTVPFVPEKIIINPESETPSVFEVNFYRVVRFCNFTRSSSKTPFVILLCIDNQHCSLG